VTHVQQWRQQFDKLESVDLRYDGQIIVNPDLEGMARQPVLTPAAKKAAMAAGVKTAAIVNYEKYATRLAVAAPVKPAKKDVKGGVKGTHKPVVQRAAAHHSTTKETQSKAPGKITQGKAVQGKAVQGNSNQGNATTAKSAAAKPTPARPVAIKSPPVTQAALKTKETMGAVVVPKNTAGSHSSVSSAVSPAASRSTVNAGSKKPSAGIPKETPQN
jgi:hypothetical protein